MSSNSNISIDFVKRYVHRGWTWNSLTYNKSISIKDIEDNIDFSWDWYQVSRRDDLTIDFLIKYKDKFRNIIPDQIVSRFDIEGFDFGYNIYDIFNIATMPFNLVEKYKSKILYRKYSLPRNPFLTPKFIDENIDKFSLRALSSSPCINIGLVKKFKDLKWDWFRLSKNPAIDVKDIEDNIELPWEWGGISCNPNLTYEFLNDTGIKTGIIIIYILIIYIYEII